MPNIGIHGFTSNRHSLQLKVGSCLTKIGLGREGVTEIFNTNVDSCHDGTPSPYLRLFSSDVEHIPLILAGLQKDGIHEDIEVLNPPMFFTKDEIASGAWMEKFKKKVSPRSAEITLEDLIREAVGVVDMFDQANTNKAVENLGSRGRILKEAVESLRAVLNAGETRTALTAEQAK